MRVGSRSARFTRAMLTSQGLVKLALAQAGSYADGSRVGELRRCYRRKTRKLLLTLQTSMNRFA